MEAGGCEGTGNRMRLGPERGSAERGDGLRRPQERAAPSPIPGPGRRGSPSGAGRRHTERTGSAAAGPPGLRGPAGAGSPHDPALRGAGLCRSPFSGARRSSRPAGGPGPDTEAGTPTAAAPPGTPSLEVTLPPTPGPRTSASAGSRPGTHPRPAPRRRRRRRLPAVPSGL